MTQSKHTPGPWSYNPTPDSKENDFCIWGAHVYDGAMGQHESEKVAFIRGQWGQTKDTLEANAKHIVKCVNSHDGLLEALELALEFLPEGGDPHNAAQAAISKARNEN